MASRLRTARSVITPCPRIRVTFNIIKRATRRLVRQLRDEAEAVGATPLVEAELRSPSCSLWGRPDLVLLYPDRSADVIDFKTGAHFEDAPAEREQFQLELYVSVAV